jgi:very-short-patch-repair endonuclease
MFLSMVDSPRGEPLPRRDRIEFQQRYNVAASRARNQMWLIYSLNHEADLKPGDLRRRLIEHAIDPSRIAREVAEASSRTESLFEKEVCDRLIRRGYRVHPQWEVGRYRIDLVVEGSGVRLAVECDGDRYHPIEKLPEDMARQTILERLGWRFLRIRGSVFFRDPEAEMERVFSKLMELGSFPSDEKSDAASNQAENDTRLVDEITRHAARLRSLWTMPDSLDEGTDESREAPDNGDVVGSGMHLVRRP